MSVFLRWIGLGGGLLTLAAIAFLSSQSLRRVRTDTAWVDHTHQVLASIASVRLLVTEVASSRRGFVTTGNPIERERYLAAQQLIDRELAALTTLVGDNPGELANAWKFAPLISRWRAVLDSSIAAQDRNGFVFQEQNDYTEKARPLATGIHDLARRMAQEEEHLLAVRQAEARTSAQRTGRIVIVGNLLGFVLLLLATFISVNELGARRNAEARFRGLLESAPDAMVIADEAGKIVLVNAQTERLFGYSRDELLGRNVDVLVPPRFREKHPEHRAAYVAQPRSRPMGAGTELFGQRKDGTEFPVEVSLSPLRTKKGVVVSSAIRDITERKRRALQLELANMELEAFSYSVSHDLRAPLRAIDGFSQALLEESGDRLDESGKRYLGRVRAGAQRMAELIDDLLSLSKVSQKNLDRSPVDLSEIAAEVFAALARAEPDRKVAFQVARQINADADEGLLRIVLQNLIGNAWKFTSKRADAEIEFGVREAGGERQYFVRDNGAGFDQAYAGKLFGAFQRLHAAGEFPGTGIGLATVARIVHRHGGKVGAEGRVGEGATFWFTL